MRFDRLITVGLVSPLRKVGFGSASNGLPILMYHNIGEAKEPAAPPYYRTDTSPAVFRRHMGCLSDMGYQTITVGELVARLNQGEWPETKQIAITFDDGFRTFYTEAYPVLEQFGFTATVFLPTAFVGGRGLKGQKGGRHSFKGEECLTWDEVEDLRRSGIEFGSHTVNHPRLVELPWEDIRSELYGSRSELEQQLGESVTSFCYPYAFPQADRNFVEGFKQLLMETGYTCCATTELGRVRLGDDPYRLRRLPANSLDDPGFFRAKLNGSYDWLGLAQTVSKTLKRTALRAGSERAALTR